MDNLNKKLDNTDALIPREGEQKVGEAREREQGSVSETAPVSQNPPVRKNLSGAEKRRRKKNKATEKAKTGAFQKGVATWHSGGLPNPSTNNGRYMERARNRAPVPLCGIGTGTSGGYGKPSTLGANGAGVARRAGVSTPFWNATAGRSDGFGNSNTSNASRMTTVDRTRVPTSSWGVRTEYSGVFGNSSTSSACRTAPVDRTRAPTSSWGVRAEHSGVFGNSSTSSACRTAPVDRTRAPTSSWGVRAEHSGVFGNPNISSASRSAIVDRSRTPTSSWSAGGFRNSSNSSASGATTVEGARGPTSFWNVGAGHSDGFGSSSASRTGSVERTRVSTPPWGGGAGRSGSFGNQSNPSANMARADEIARFSTFFWRNAVGRFALGNRNTSNGGGMGITENAEAGHFGERGSLNNPSAERARNSIPRMSVEARHFGGFGNPSANGAGAPNLGSFPTRKRLRTDEEVSDSPEPPAKRGPEALRSAPYAKPAKAQLRVVTIPDGYPPVKLNEGQYAEIRKSIAKALNEIPPGEFNPRFQSTYLNNGAMITICADVESKDWLKKLIPELKPWEGPPSLKVAGQRIRAKKATLWVSEPEMEPEKVLSMLMRQNPGLDTTEWIIYGRGGVTDKGFSLVVGVDLASLKTLQALNFKPHLGLGRVAVKMHSAIKGEHK